MSYSLEKVPLCGVPFSTPSCRRCRSLCSNKTREERNDIRAPVITGDKRCDYRFPKEGECSEWAGRYVCVCLGVYLKGHQGMHLSLGEECAFICLIPWKPRTCPSQIFRT